MTNAELRAEILRKTYIREDCAGWINRLGILAADAGMRMSDIPWGSTPLAIVVRMVELVDNGACKREPLMALLGAG
jgi:hypothetical protein